LPDGIVPAIEKLLAGRDKKKAASSSTETRMQDAP
jgi:hypothetical protein